MKETNVFGIPANIPSAEDIEEMRQQGGSRIYMVKRVADMDFTDAPPALRKRVFTARCDVCMEMCYVDPLAYNPFRELNLVLTCTRCVAKRRGIAHP